MPKTIPEQNMHVILGATEIGSIIADFLLSKGETVRVVGRDEGRLQRFVGKERGIVHCRLERRGRAAKPSTSTRC